MRHLFVVGPFVLDDTPVYLKFDRRSVRGSCAMQDLMPGSAQQNTPLLVFLRVEIRLSTKPDQRHMFHSLDWVWLEGACSEIAVPVQWRDICVQRQATSATELA